MKAKLTCYTPGAIIHHSFLGATVVDIYGIIFKDPPIPCLREHRRTGIAGKIVEIEITPDGLMAVAELSGSTADGKEIAALLTESHPLEVSIGCEILKVRPIKEGKTEILNGKKISGPITIITRALLREISFVSLGADSQTSAQRLAASAQGGGTVSLSSDELKICNLLKVDPEDFTKQVTQTSAEEEQNEIKKICQMLSISTSDFHESRRQLRAAGLI